jgi:hypothetical protein
VVDDNVAYEQVSSSNLHSVGYDPENSNLFVIFQDATGGPGRKYVYYHCPQSVYAELMAAPSKGKFLHAHVKNKFSYDQI